MHDPSGRAPGLALARLPELLWSQAAAIVFSYAHTLEDWIVGLFGMDRGSLSPSAALLLGLHGLVYAAWAVALALAVRGDRGWAAALFVLTFGWAFLVNGVSIAFCLPPCGALPPYADAAHLGSLVFGAWASLVAWRWMRAGGGSLATRQAALALVLLVVANVISSALAAEFFSARR